MLQKGHWDNFEMKQTSDYSLRLPNGDWAYSGRFVPDTCQLHDYETGRNDKRVSRIIREASGILEFL